MESQVKIVWPGVVLPRHEIEPRPEDRRERGATSGVRGALRGGATPVLVAYARSAASASGRQE
eukprot:4442923-Pleurochrysis_carterae.AAC.1